MDAVLREIREGLTGYASLVDQVSRTSARARILHLLDDLGLERGDLATQRVTGRELRDQPFLRGAITIHLDLVFRSSLTLEEIVSTADHGMVFLAVREDLDGGIPIGVILAQPTTGLVRRRRDLFRAPPPLAEAGTLMPFALAASPPRLGAAAALFGAIMKECGELPSRPRVITLSPLTGMRARVIRLVDEGWDAVRRLASATHAEVDTDLLREQLLTLLGFQRLPAVVPQPARGWLEAEAQRYASASEYQVGNFHRALGASLVGVVTGADPADSDALWARAYFDHGRPESRI